MSNTNITRTSYGELRQTDGASRPALLDAADSLLAASASKLPAAHDSLEWGTSGRERGHKIGTARYHEIYDVNATGTRALICVREVEGTKYGQRTTSKAYFVLARHGRGARVLAANKAVAAKAAKAAGDTLGSAIDTALGKCKLAVKASEIRTGYKLLARTDVVGCYASAWDGSIWAAGIARIEAATDDHTGGYYYYATLAECLAAAESNEVFGAHRDAHRLAVVEVQASGRHYAHQGAHGTKLCATRVTPLREIASTL